MEAHKNKYENYIQNIIHNENENFKSHKLNIEADN